MSMNTDRRVIVIGSGPSGAIAAWQLVRRGIPTVLLESGVMKPEGALVRVMGRNIFRRRSSLTEASDAHMTVSGDSRTNWFFNLAIGGLSNNWTGAVPRFDPEDFTEGERLHEQYRWPVSYHELEPYYEQVERLMSVSGGTASMPQLPAGHVSYPVKLPADWRRVGDAAAKRGHGFTPLPLADGPPWMAAKRSTAFNSFSVIVKRLLHSPLFHMITGAHVLEITWSASKRLAEGVIYYDRVDNVERRLSSAAVVVAAGALHSTKLLFQSLSSDFPHGLGNSRGLLGQYLHDHPKEWWVMHLDRPIASLGHAAYMTRAPYADLPPLMGASWTIGHASNRDKLLSLMPLKRGAVGVQVFGTTVPSSLHMVRPHTSRTDTFGRPVLDINISYGEAVSRNMEAARDRILSVMADAGYGAAIREIVPQLHPGRSVHYGGTVRMHSSRAYGVLDGWNRLHDVQNVIVCDTSCFTTGPEKNPTLTAMALAARAADRLADDVKVR